MLRTKKDSRKAIIFSFLCFLLISFYFRLPFFFKDVINWDESTFILTGQSLLDGHLPYTKLWDLKPPLLPASFALFIMIFGKSIISIRVAGAICVALTSWFTYWIGSTLKSHRLGLLAGILSVASLSTIGFDFRATMSEHIAIVPLMGATLILMQERQTFFRLLWVGLILAVATMIRLNLAYVTLIAGILITFGITEGKITLNSFRIRKSISRASAYSLGFLIVILLTFLPYLITGKAQIWWDSVVLAPLNYSGSRYSFWQALLLHLNAIRHLLFDWFFQPGILPSEPTAVAIVIFLGALLGMAKTIIFWRTFSSQRKRNTIVISAFFLSTVFSILKGGQAHFHYLIQIMPFLSLYAALIYEPIFKVDRLKKTIPITVILALLMSSGALQAYGENFNRIVARENLLTGSAYKISDYFKQSDITDKSFYMMTGHIAYWFIGKEPLTRASTHPSNISKEYLLEYSIGPGATAELAMREILNQDPDFIVTRSDLWYLENYDDARALIETALKTRYKLVKEVQSTLVYQIKN